MPSKKYLKPGGLLLANNSHGDSGVAFLDPEFRFIGVINRRKAHLVLSNKELEEYFIPKKEQEASVESLVKLGRCLGYKKLASLYLFETN